LSIFNLEYPRGAVSLYAALQALLEEGQEPPIPFSRLYSYSRSHNFELPLYSDLENLEAQYLVRIERKYSKAGKMVDWLVWPLEEE